MKKVVFVRDGDWEGLYVNGKLKIQNHSIMPIEVLEALDIKYEIVEADGDWLYKVGRLPDKLSEVKVQDDMSNM